MTHKLLLVATILTFISSQTLRADTANQIGIVLMTQGDVKATDGSGTVRELARRSPLFTGDEINVGEKSKIQLRFTDATLMTLGEMSSYRVDTYQFKAKGEDAFLSKLAKGSLRALPGAIDKGNAEAVKIATPVAVMGVRGTLFSLGAGEKGTSVGFFQGAGWIENETGRLNLGEGSKFDFAFLSSGESILGQGRLSEPTELFALEQGRAVVPTAAASKASTEGAATLSESQIKSITTGLQKYAPNDKRPILKLWDRQVELRAEGLDCHCSL